ncbi:hypothetical protein [Pararhizobium sp.]|uniref:hypothetical protein n=1 Tax=Pararhizobium sp. TaxID=1977563 RepID=UPI003D0E095A
MLRHQTTLFWFAREQIAVFEVSLPIKVRVEPMGEQLRIQYDCVSKTVLVQLGDNSHVLPDQFADKDSAENAAKSFARDSWAYESPEENRSKNASPTM